MGIGITSKPIGFPSNGLELLCFCYPICSFFGVFFRGLSLSFLFLLLFSGIDALFFIYDYMPLFCVRAHHSIMFYVLPFDRHRTILVHSFIRSVYVRFSSSSTCFLPLFLTSAQWKNASNVIHTKSQQKQGWILCISCFLPF